MVWTPSTSGPASTAAPMKISSDSDVVSSGTRWQAQACALAITEKHMAAAKHLPVIIAAWLATSTAAALSDGGLVAPQQYHGSGGTERRRPPQLSQGLDLPSGPGGPGTPQTGPTHLCPHTCRVVSVVCWRCQGCSSMSEVHSCAYCASMSIVMNAWPRVPLASHGLHTGAQKARCPALFRPGPGN